MYTYNQEFFTYCTITARSIDPQTTESLLNKAQGRSGLGNGINSTLGGQRPLVRIITTSENVM